MKVRQASTNQLDPAFDADGHQVRSGLDAYGRELNDPVPLSPPVNYEVPATLEQIVERLVRGRELAAAADAAGYETFDEADDFEVAEEDYDPRFPETIYEAYFEAKSKRRAQAEARRAEASRTASADLVSAAPLASQDQKPTGASLDDKSKAVEPPGGTEKVEVSGK